MLTRSQIRRRLKSAAVMRRVLKALKNPKTYACFRKARRQAMQRPV